MRKGQRGKFIGNENYDGDLVGGELFTVTELIEHFPEEKSWVFRMELDTGGGECLLSDMVEMFTEADDLMTLKNLINKYPEQAWKICKTVVLKPALQATSEIDT